MVRTDKYRAPFLAGLADAPANGRRGFHFKVYVLGACLYCPLQDLRRTGFFCHAAGSDEGDVGLGEQLLNRFVGEGAAVKAYFRHLKGGQKRLNLR
jgi:hypothetical protein